MNKRPRQEASQSDVARRGLVSLNKLDYTLQPDLSVCVSRSYKKHFFQQSEYAPGSRAICILNSGAEYADPQNSYLKLVVTNKGVKGFHLGIGSGCNFIRRVILTSRSGDEIERVEGVNRLAPLLERMHHSANWLDTHGAMQGYARGPDSVDGASTSIGKATGTTIDGQGIEADPGTGAKDTRDTTFIIPLSSLCGLFKSFDRLLPSMLLSGMRFEVEFANTAESGFNTDGDFSWVIKPEITLDQYSLTDSIMRVLNEEASMRGLEIVFSSYFNHESSNTGATANVEIRKAVSRALGVMSCVHSVTASQMTDFVKTEPFSLTSYQVRVGSLYFPQQPIKAKDANSNAMECYFHTQRGIGKIKTPSAPTSVTPADFEKGLAVMYTDLERSSVQRLTGIPVNNSRVVSLSMEGLPDSDPVIISTYLHYVRLLRVFLQNVEVEE